MAKIADFRQNEKEGFADLLNYAGLVDDGIIVNKDGSFMAGFAIKGPDVANATDEERNYTAFQLNTALARLGNGYMIHTDAVRRRSDAYPKPDVSHFPDRVSRIIDEERREAFEKFSSHFETETIVVLTYLPPTVNDNALSKFFFERADNTDNAPLAEKILSDFKRAADQFEKLLANSMRIDKLGTYEFELETGETILRCSFLEHLRFCITGEDYPVNLPDQPFYLDYLLGGQFISGTTPRIKNNAIGCVSVTGFPLQTHPGILAHLDNLAMTYRWSTRFIFLSEHTAVKKMQKERRNWNGQILSFFEQVTGIKGRSPNQDAMNMVNDADLAIQEANEGLVTFGYYTTQIIIYNEDVAYLEELTKFVEQQMNKAGFSAKVEGLNANDCYMGSLPGNGYANIRRPMLNTLNLAHLLPVNSVWAGHHVNPCPFYPPESPPLMQVGSGGQTPFRINLHVNDVGHTLVFGPTGNGKSTLLSLMCAQFRRYRNSQVFAFDKGRSIMPLCKSVGGIFYDVASEDDENILFSPLSTLETAEDQAWAEEWITSLAVMQGISVTPKHRTAIHDAMELTMKAKSKRSMTNFISSLQDNDLKEALKYYSIDGALKYLLDSEEDGLESNSFIAFEMETLMNMGEKALVPVLLYLFHRLEKMMDGRPTMLVLDEAWVMLGHDVFRDKIREWLKVLRRKNCVVVLSTQSLSDAANSGITDVLYESCPSKILLPNKEARTEHSRAFYQQMGLNSKQVEIIANAIPKRDYYMVTPEGKRLFNMELGPVALSFVGVSGAEDLKHFNSIYNPHDPAWVERWLQARGIKQDWIDGSVKRIGEEYENAA